MIRFLIAALALLLLATGAASAAEEEAENVYEGQDEVFEALREDYYEGYAGDTVEDVIKKFFEEGEVDEGTYPSSEYWEHGGDLRRTKPEELAYNGRVYFKHSDDEISGVNKFEKELELNTSYDNWSSYLRLSDENAFAKNDDPFRIEKFQLRHRQGRHKITIGSFGALFGRGLALNMFEERFLDFDNEAEGVKIEYDFDKAYVTALWGTRKNRGQPFHSTVTGARVEVPINKNLTVGAHAVEVQFPSLIQPQPEVGGRSELNYDLLGANVDARIGDLRLYTEVVTLDRGINPLGDSHFDIEGKNGRGLYVNAGYAGDGFAISGEYKEYYGLLQPFTTLPPLRRWQEQAQADANDDVGYAFELILNPFEDGSLFTFDYGQGTAKDIPAPYTEFIAVYSSPTGRKLSYVFEFLDINFHGDKRVIKRLSWSRLLDADWTLGGMFETERYKVPLGSDYSDTIYGFELAYQSEWSVVYTAERTGIPDIEPNDWELFEIKYRPDEDQEWNLVHGSRREGFVCSGGVCRLEPAFDGLRLDYLRRF